MKDGSMMLPRIYADFQNLDDFNRLKLASAGTAEDVARLGVQLRDGLMVTFYTDDADDEGRADELLVEGIVRFNEDERCWVAEVDWNAVRHASDEARVSQRDSNALR